MWLASYAARGSKIGRIISILKEAAHDEMYLHCLESVTDPEVWSLTLKQIVLEFVTIDRRERVTKW